MCGEKAAVGTVVGVVGSGSPPRVRGKEQYRELAILRKRITPACAGKSLCPRCSVKLYQDHPRVCGEKLVSTLLCQALPGSPPRVRGKAMIPSSPQAQIRITPACAGKSRSCLASRLCIQDHPRVCGEKPVPGLQAWDGLGSPPRVRGKVISGSFRIIKRGITPACAGKRLKKAHKIKDFDPVPIRFHLVFRRFERWCSNLPTPDGNVPV